MEKENFYQNLCLGLFYDSLTSYKNVKELSASNFKRIDCVTMNINKKCWRKVNNFYTETHKDSFEESVETVDGYLNTTVKIRVDSSDLKVGYFLSGDIDSGLITAMASNYKNKIKIFTVSFDGDYDEAPLAKMVANKYYTHHTEIKISFDNLKNDIEKICYNYNESFFNSSAIPSY